MQVNLGIGVKAKPSFRELQQKLRLAIQPLAAGGGPLSFLEDCTGLLDFRLAIEDGLYVVDVPIPRENQQITTTTPARRGRRGARLREEPSELDLQLLEDIALTLNAISDTRDRVIELSSSTCATELQDSHRELQESTKIKLAAIRKDVATRTEPLVVRLPNQREFGFRVPPAVRRTVVAETPAVLYVQASAQGESVDLHGPVAYKAPAPDASVADDVSEGQQSDGFKVGRQYGFRFSGLTSAQRAVLVAAWALGCDVGLVARFAASTTTTKAAPAEVDEVLAWSRLVHQVIEALLAAVATPYRRYETDGEGPDQAHCAAA